MQRAAPDKSRIEPIDIARGTALAAMAIYHFGWDLEFFGYLDAGTTAHGGWRLFARAIASSFLFLVGVSLVLAHEKSVRWRSFAVRLLMVAGAAAAISLVTFLAVPGGFIFFGILHQIALASVLGLVFLRLPPLLTLAVAALVVAAPFYLRSPFFDHPAWWWVGLSSRNPPSNDYVPLFPWFGAVLAGIAAAKIARAAGFLAWLSGFHPVRWAAPLKLAGRHSLAVYLAHQPILISLVWAMAQVWPAPAQAPEAQFMSACTAQCAETRDTAFCTRYCICVLDIVESEGRLDGLVTGSPDEAAQSRLQQIAGECSLRADAQAQEGTGQNDE